MQKVIKIDEINSYSDRINQSLIDYITNGQIETYESFGDFNLVAFDWYDIKKSSSQPAQILIYIDSDDLFYICENERSYNAAASYFVSAHTNEYAMYLFFKNLFSGNTEYLEKTENRVSALDDDIIDGTNETLREKLVEIRNEVLHAKKYFEQLEFLFDEICDNDNGLISADGIKLFETLHNRSVRLVSQVLNLREYTTQVRESYQSQIGLEQSNLMKVFTLVTSIFMPLTLIAGWYGMNLKLPEFSWEYGYLFVIILSVAVSAVWIIIFKRKKWFK